MKKQLLMAGAITMVSAGLVFADDTTTTTTTSTTTTETTTGINQRLGFDKSTQGLYQPGEISLDAFGADAWRDHTWSHLGNYNNHQSHLAAGLGANYFLIRYVGVGVDAYSFNTSHNFVDNLGGNLIVRIPLFLGFAPYAFGGAGHGFDPVPLTYGDAGGGMEFRFVHNFGIFADARYVWTDKIRNYSMGRVGLRLAF